MRIASARLALMAQLALVSCVPETTVRMPPIVHAGSDVSQFVEPQVTVQAEAVDPDGTVTRFDWTILAAPDLAKASIARKNELGDTATLATGGLAGIYLLSVTATDDDGMVSEPEYLNVTLHANQNINLSVACVSGCSAGALGPEADEEATIQLKATATGGAAPSFAWSATLTRAAQDPFVTQPILTPAGDTLTVKLPRVNRPAVLEATVRVPLVAGREAVAKLRLTERNTSDELPTIRLEWRQPGATAAAAPDAVVLPGDALHVYGVATDPNGDAVTCTFQLDPASIEAEIEVSPNDSCRATVYPLRGGNLQLRGKATTATPPGEVTAPVLTVGVKAFDSAEPSFPAPRLVALDRFAEGSQIGVLAAGEDGRFYVYRQGMRSVFDSGLSGVGATCAAIAVGRVPQMGLIGFSGSGALARYSVTGNAQASNVIWNTARVPSTFRNLAAQGNGGRVFGATDLGIAIYEEGRDLALWPATNLDIGSVAVGPSPDLTAGQAIVWFAIGSKIHNHPSADSTTWGWAPATAEGDLNGPVVTALAAATSRTWDLWAGTAAGNPGERRGLYLFRNSVNAVTRRVVLGAAELVVDDEAGVRSIRVERSGFYEGDAWVVVGERLVRVSRAPLNDLQSTRAVKVMNLSVGSADPAVRGVLPFVAGVGQLAIAACSGLMMAR